MCASCLFSYLLVSDRCEDCGIVFGAYACLECRIFDSLDDENSDLKKEGVFHCDLCGICRIGKRSEFVHCSVCNCCRRITSSSSSSNSSSPLSSLTSSSSGRRREWEEEEDSSDMHTRGITWGVDMNSSSLMNCDGVKTARLSDHVCIENALNHNCALCLEYLFDSPKPLETLGCGHIFHKSCLGDLIARSCICPICRAPM